MVKFNKEKLDVVRKRYNLSLVILFGSQVDGRVHPKSDLDIAVVRNDQSLELNLIRLISDLIHIFNNDRVDLVDLTHADPLLLFATASKSRLLSGEEKDYENLLLRAYLRYSDYIPYLDMERDFVLGKLKDYVATR
ncbi:hypothetical protein A3A75_03070 [Candidatus Woesebacteria bacterium RIFCSPLOWO2_01_FULL_39_10]|uniref:Polymerase beta nucleotidyltransferase domain-containing protein n=1 Tax=Candidatus Woesebacteria bacterium RIFCSPLOWO2_01_FULL_39_10 TaxID=1802516 RepID=A0A1F8B560_9BACT|nr:MAG: hypothetical protein A3A75_03070 [Candidatus Woesebacteria bacterium RIFCSPLOWO2_01_FULL_39_10]